MRGFTPAAIRIRLLGPVDVVPGCPDLGGPKRRLLLGALALRRGTVASASWLVGTLWPRDHPDDPRRSLQVHVSKLRKSLLAAGVDAGIEHRDGGYVLEVAPHLIDVTWFERLVEEGVATASDDPDRARSTLRQALALWRGAPLGGLADASVLRSEVARLEDVYLRALTCRIDADLVTGHHDDVVPELQQLTAEHPLQEPLWGSLLLALYRAGRQGEALAAYERARRVLAGELGADPSRELQQLHRRILDQDPALHGSRLPAGAVESSAREREPSAHSVAVLPFEVIGGSSDAALLASGLHTDLLTALSRSTQLTVISRSSVLGYRGTDAPAPRIARELGVGTLVTGTVQSVGRRFRLTVQLVDGPRGVPRWTESYDDEVTTDNLFTIQTDLARGIAASLSTELLPVPEGTWDQPPTEELAAYRLVAAGRQQFDLKTAEGFTEAVACYQEATRLDPDYAAAWLGLCDSLVSADAYGHGARHELLPRAERAVHRALALSPGSAEARTSLGVLAIAYQDGPMALAELERARELRASYADAHNWHSWISLLVGDAPAGLDSALRAAELDPRAPEPHAHVALGLAATGDPGGGLRAARTARSLSPYPTADLYEALCLYELGRAEDVREVLSPFVGDDHELPVAWTEGGLHALLALALLELDDPGAARTLAAAVDPRAFPFAAGLIQLAFGATEEAERTFDRIDRLTAWPCLIVHHFHRRLWNRKGAARLHAMLVDVALRSWRVVPPGDRGKRAESGS